MKSFKFVISKSHKLQFDIITIFQWLVINKILKELDCKIIDSEFLDTYLYFHKLENKKDYENISSSKDLISYLCYNNFNCKRKVKEKLYCYETDFYKQPCTFKTLFLSIYHCFRYGGDIDNQVFFKDYSISENITFAYIMIK